jgi:hypothetical protein
LGYLIVISTGVGETLFFFLKRSWGESGTTVQKWGHFGIAVGAGLASGHVGSDIGSVSQPLEATKACFK